METWNGILPDARLATGLVEIAGVIVAVAIDGSADTEKWKSWFLKTTRKNQVVFMVLR